MSQIWDATKIKGLRLRLGWSQSDLARRLACDSDSVRIWEEESASPNETQAQTLHMIFEQAELISHEMTQSAQVEADLAQNNLDFVDLASLDLPEKN